MLFAQPIQAILSYRCFVVLGYKHTAQVAPRGGSLLGPTMGQKGGTRRWSQTAEDRIAMIGRKRTDDARSAGREGPHGECGPRGPTQQIPLPRAHPARGLAGPLNTITRNHHAKRGGHVEKLNA